MLYKNPEENEQRRFRYHHKLMSTISEKEIEQHCVWTHYQQINESEWRQEYIPKIQAALKKLPRKQAKVIDLYIFHDMGQVEIARLLNCSQQAVSGLYIRAIKNLRKHIIE
ncbi:sigma-70 family RNA polymerase sigma factor [Ruminococcaceae bacterium OttesenSCG-928-L11]|nr:sigma-70 family RNA polymerase sigma factor [Ruminococcaceae bacterium OttesenSCG-928-L11]